MGVFGKAGCKEGKVFAATWIKVNSKYPCPKDPKKIQNKIAPIAWEPTPLQTPRFWPHLPFLRIPDKQALHLLDHLLALPGDYDGTQAILGIQIPSKKVFNLPNTPPSTFLEAIWSPRANGCLS